MMKIGEDGFDINHVELGICRLLKRVETLNNGLMVNKKFTIGVSPCTNQRSIN